MAGVWRMVPGAEVRNNGRETRGRVRSSVGDLKGFGVYKMPRRAGRLGTLDSGSATYQPRTVGHVHFSIPLSLWELRKRMNDKCLVSLQALRADVLGATGHDW